MSVGQRVKTIRLARGKTQEELAEYLDRSRQAVIRIESDRVKLDIDVLKKIALFLDCPLSEILGEEIIETTITPKEESKNDNVLLTSLADVFNMLEKYSEQGLTEKDKQAFKQILNIIEAKYLDD